MSRPILSRGVGAWAGWVCVGGCGVDAPLSNHVEDVRVIAIRTDPPEIAPGIDALDLEVWVADPRRHGVELVVWSCTDLGYGCAEAWRTVGGGRPLSSFVRVDRPADGHLAIRWSPGGLDADQLPAEVERQEAVALLWALACAPGRCDLVDRVLADPVPGSPAWLEAVDMLGDPRAALAGVRLDHAHLAVKTIPVKDEPSDLDNANPSVELQRGELVALVGSGLSRPLQLVVSDPDADGWDVQLYATLGAVEALPRDGSSSELGVSWTPLWTRGEGSLWVVVDDRRGGIGVWSGALLVGTR